MLKDVVNGKESKLLGLKNKNKKQNVMFVIPAAAECDRNLLLRSTGPVQPVEELDVTGMTLLGQFAPIGEVDL